MKIGIRIYKIGYGDEKMPMDPDLKNRVLNYIRWLDDVEDSNANYCCARHGVRYFLVKYGNGINNVPLELPCNNQVAVPGTYCADHMRREAYAYEKVPHYWFNHYDNGSILGDYTVECRMMGSRFYNAHVELWGAPCEEDLKIAQLCKDKTMSRAAVTKEKMDKSLVQSKQLKLFDMGFESSVPKPVATPTAAPPSPKKRPQRQSKPVATTEPIKYPVYMTKGRVDCKESDCAPCTVEAILKIRLKALPDHHGYYAGDNGSIYSKDAETGHYRKLGEDEIKELESVAEAI